VITILDIARTITRGVDRFIGDYAQVYLTGTAGADVARDWRWKWEKAK
jgi:hypothetical protein